MNDTIMKWIIAVFFVLMFAQIATADEWSGYDKKVHFAGSAALAGLMVTEDVKPVNAVLFTVGVGAFKEATDSRFSGKDMTANIAGAIFGAVAADYLTWRW